MITKAVHVLASLIITPIGAVFALLLFFFCIVGTVQALVSELTCCALRVFQIKKFAYKAFSKKSNFTALNQKRLSEPNSVHSLLPLPRLPLS